MAKIKRVVSREILDSRGDPTLETEVHLDDGVVGIASVPSGTSVGSHEALEYRDCDPARYNGMGVLKAVANVENTLAPAIIGKEITKQKDIDTTLINLDGTKNKTRLGANAILSLSLACARSASKSLKIPLYRYINITIGNTPLPPSSNKMPTPSFNVINGGKHGYGNLDFQEFHIVPNKDFPYNQSLRIGAEIYQALKKILEYRGIVRSVGDEGGFAPNLFTNKDALETLVEAIGATPYKIKKDILIGLDIAATNFFHDGKYFIKDSPQPLSTDDLINYYLKLIEEYHIISIEDGLNEDDWIGWRSLTAALKNHNVITIGDDLLATNPERLEVAISDSAITGAIIKPNQIGSLTETLAVIKRAREAGMKITVSHRSGETNDTFIADLAVGVNADFVKFGAPARGERVAKYNRLLIIEEELKPIA